MKKIVSSCIVLFISLQMQAQKSDQESGDEDNYCIQNDGNKISVIYQGVIILSDVVLDNGAIVKTDGTVKTKGGKITLVRTGECINRDGTISTSDSEGKPD